MSDVSATESVLVIDDNLQNRHLAEAQLASAGYEVVLAESGEKGLERFLERTPDLVLLDVKMPGMDGFETCRRMRQLPGGNDVPIVFVTAAHDLESYQKALSCGADDFLSKPVQQTELLLRVRSLVRIRRQQKALVTAQRQKEDLQALVVHDLKNPLTTILANVAFALRDARLSAEVREALDDVLGATRTMHRMVMNLLDISRSEDGALTPRLTDVNVPELLGSVVSEMTRRADEAGQRLELSASLRSPVVRADRDLLRRVVENLVDNALKYTPSGGTIRVEAEREDGRLRVSVRDQGRGIPPSQRERIFEKYAQLEQRDEPYLRTSRGLGLVFCRLAVQAHRGRIWVEDGRPGSVFIFELPAEEPSS